jgi:hypothetical protein
MIVAMRLEPESPAPDAFPVMLGAAAEISGQSPESICDYIRAGVLPCAIQSTGVLETSVWLPTVKIQAMIRSEDGIPVDRLSPEQMKVIGVCREVRALFDAKPPETTAERAVALHTGLVAQNRQRVAHLLVRADDIAEHARNRPGASDMARFATVVESALKAAGASQVRGIRGLDDQKQNWSIWYRLPHSLARPEVGEAGTWMVDFPQLNPELYRRPENSPLFTEPLA